MFRRDYLVERWVFGQETFRPRVIRFLLQVLALASIILLGGLLAAAEPLPTAKTVGGVEYVAVAAVRGRYNFQSTALAEDRLRLHSKWTKLDIKLDSRMCHCNGQLLYLNAPVVPATTNSPVWLLARPDLDLVIDPLLRSADHLAGRRLRTILIDPGHGGRDTGARTGSGELLLEKDAALDLAKRLQTLLVKAGFTVRLTRAADRDLELENRPRLAARHRADLFVSLHFNHAGNANVSGIETFALTPARFGSTHAGGGGPDKDETFAGNANDAANFLAAYDIQTALVKRTKAGDRGVKRARWTVLREAPCPGVLVEAGFLSNAAEAGRIRSEAHRQLLAEGIAEGIQAYGARLRR